MRPAPALAALTLLTLAAAAPFALAAGALALAASIGCGLDEGSPHACALLGRDIGEDLRAAFVLGPWTSLAAPLLLPCGGFWTWILVRRRLRTPP